MFNILVSRLLLLGYFLDENYHENELVLKCFLVVCVNFLMKLANYCVYVYDRMLEFL